MESKCNIVIDIENITKRFKENEVLKGISFSIRRGEIFGLLGPSGAGKTTLIKILTGQMLANSGRALVFDTMPDKLSREIYSRIGMVLDNSGLYDRLSCYDNLLLYTKIFKVSKERIYEVAEYVELTDALKTAVGKLSKGMRQRLVLARAILHQPQLLFMDEPTSGLDPATTVKIHKLIFELREKGATILLTTHDMEEASKLCDNIALLHEGKIIEYGEPDAICRRHNTEDKVKILCKNGKMIVLPNRRESAKEIATYFYDEDILSIHTSEPTLETVFIALTGRGLL